MQSRWNILAKRMHDAKLDKNVYVPRNFGQWLQHQAEFAEIVAAERRQVVANLEAELRTNRAIGRLQPYQPLGDKIFDDGLSTVLAIPTHWTPLSWPRPIDDRPGAPWPSREEFKEEGDERNNSGFGRFFPIPRVAGNETVVWKQKAFLPAREFDFVKPVADRSEYNIPEDSDDEFGFVAYSTTCASSRTHCIGQSAPPGLNSLCDLGQRLSKMVDDLVGKVGPVEGREEAELMHGEGDRALNVAQARGEVFGGTQTHGRERPGIAGAGDRSQQQSRRRTSESVQEQGQTTQGAARTGTGQPNSCVSRGDSPMCRGLHGASSCGRWRSPRLVGKI
jgi:hypothetical protein